MPDKNAPKTIEEAIDHIAKMENADKWAALPEDQATTASHHGIGRGIRNEWSLWAGGTLSNHIKEHLGIEHPDDMSGIILASAHRHINGKPLDLEGQAAYYKEYWRILEKDGVQYAGEFVAEQAAKGNGS